MSEELLSLAGFVLNKKIKKMWGRERKLQCGGDAMKEKKSRN